MKAKLIVVGILLVVFACKTEPKQGVDVEISDPVVLFKTHCAICHGEDGRKGFSGATMLPGSELSVAERVAVITKGRKTMMAYEGVLSEAQILDLAEYTTTLK